jgi:hypothetical protein
MNLKKNCFQPQNRRGLSSVVGALFFTVLMIAGFSVLSLALDAQEDIVITQRVISDIEIKKQQEEFGVLASVDGNDILSVSIQNQGQNPVEVSSMWIINKTLSDQPAKRYTINYNDAFVSSGLTNNVLSSQTLQIIPDVYGIKVITTLGSIKTVEFDTVSGSSFGLRAELITDPPDVIIGQNVTIAMIVTNTGYETIYNVQPDLLDVTGPVGTSNTTSSHTPTSIAALNGGASVMFTWDSQVSGEDDDQLTFTSMARGDDAISNPVSDISILRNAAGTNPFGGPGEIIGNVIMEFSSFQFCEPVVQDCRSDSPDWTTAWDVNTFTKYIWRVNVANIGSDNILMEQSTSFLMLHAQTAGGGNMPRVFFIKAPSTTINEDPGGYVNYSQTILKDGTPEMLYFGVDSEGSSSLERSHSAEGINAAFMLIFGYQDIDESGTVNGDDIPYSQNLAYQGLRLTD